MSMIHTSIHAFSGTMVAAGCGGQPKCNIPLPHQLFLGDLSLFSGQPGYIVALSLFTVCPGVSAQVWCTRHTPTLRCTGGILTSCPNRLNWLLSAPNSGCTLSPQPTLPHPAEVAHFCRLHPQSHSFSHDPELVSTGEGWNKDRRVNRGLCLQGQLPFHRRGPVMNP